MIASSGSRTPKWQNARATYVRGRVAREKMTFEITANVSVTDSAIGMLDPNVRVTEAPPFPIDGTDELGPKIEHLDLERHHAAEVRAVLDGVAEHRAHVSELAEFLEDAHRTVYPTEIPPPGPMLTWSTRAFAVVKRSTCGGINPRINSRRGAWRA